MVQHLSTARIAIVLLSLGVVATGAGCKKGDASSSKTPVGIAECDDYLNRSTLCAASEKDPTTRARKLKDVDATRADWIKEKAKPEGTGPNMKSVCESMLRMAKNPVSSEHKECPAVF